jgi:hypothetical protein
MKNRLITIVGLIITIVLLASCTGEKKAVLLDFKRGEYNLLVTPVHVLDNQQNYYDSLSSQKIVDYINSNHYADAKPTQLVPPPNNEWRANEAKMLTISIDKFKDFIKNSNLPDNTFVLYPEFLKGGQASSVYAVHYCLVNNKGEVAMRGLLNSHWEEFKSVNPKSNDDCVSVFINGFEAKMNGK